jgi:catalase
MTSAQPDPNPVQTTDAGIPVQSDKYSLTVGADGPILRQDSYLIEQMANFNHERIKERQPHAKGSGRGFPKTFRHMNGYSSHTCMRVNGEGVKSWVKYHFISDQGIECLTQAEGDRLPGKGGPQADSAHNPPPSWYADGDLVRTAYELHAEDDDWSQAGPLVREVMDDAARDRLVGNIVGALLAGVTEPVLQRAFWYLGNVDQDLGERVEKGVRDGRRQ